MSTFARFVDGLARRIECVSEWVGRLSAWLVLAMVMLVCYDVAMRYLFQQGSVALQELEWHLFALIFLFAAAYTLKHDEHVRVDLLYQGRWMTPRRRAWVNVFGTAFFLLPFCALIISGSLPFVQSAYQFNEGSPDPGGLPYRWLLKAAIPAAFALLALQGVATLIRNLQLLASNCHAASQDRAD